MLKKIGIASLTGCLIMSLFLTGCGAKEEEMPVSSEIEEAEEEEIEEEPEEEEEVIDLTGLAVNPLTGLYIKEEDVARRPAAVVINNFSRALPQSGIGKADIYYEVVAEGGITRIITLFTDFTSEKIGPVRSTRHYFLDFALDNDAVFVHHGGSPQGYSDISSLGVNNLDGMQLEGTFFWRDPVRVSQSGMYEHSSYTSGENILSAVEKKNYREEKEEGRIDPFDFYEEATVLGGETAHIVNVNFSQSQKSVFEYYPSTGEYLRFQNGNQHIDEETGEQLSVTNIIIQQTNIYTIDNEGRQEVKLTGSGSGYLISGGQYKEITWERSSRTGQTLWKDENGDKITLNKGKTWICVLSDNIEPVFEAYESLTVSDVNDMQEEENENLE